MNAAFTIALFTLRKAQREKVYLVFLIITLAIIFAAGSVSFYSTGVQLKFLKDVSMLSISTFGFLLALFVATDLIPLEMETRGIHFLASKPVSRLSFVTGKFLALFVLIVGNLAPLAVEVLVLVRVYSGTWDWGIAVGSGLIMLEMAVYGSMIMLLSTVTTRLLALFGGILLYVVGHVSEWIIRDFLASSPRWLRVGAEIALGLVPDLSHFDSRYIVVHDYRLPPEFAALLLLYAALYIAAFLMATRWVLEAREL